MKQILKHLCTITIVLILMLIIAACTIDDKTPNVEVTEPTKPAQNIHISNQQYSDSPDNAYIGRQPYDPTNIYVTYARHFLYIEARAVEALPDTYICFSDWYSSPLRIIKMQTIDFMEGQIIPEEFYLILSEEFFVDLTQYDSLVLPYLEQYSAENGVLYNVTQQAAESFDHVLLGAPGFNGGGNIYAFCDGIWDESLWTINDVWSEDTAYERKFEPHFTTLDEAKAYFDEIQWDYYKDFNAVFYSDITFQDGIDAIRYITPFDNGVFAPSGDNASFDYRRYINGIPTNERVYISVRYETVYHSGTPFTESDLMDLPDVAAAIATIEQSCQKGEIVPPHIENYLKLDLRSHGITGWYFKSSENVYGAIRVNFTYYDESSKQFYYDDLYFIMEPASNICTEITRDELWQLQGTDDFIYTGKYDEYGKVPKDVI